MITKDTLFILGAGASMPYGFPSGADLRKTICGENYHNDLSQRFQNQMGISAELIMQFAEVFRKSKQPSIDTFLGKRQDLVDLGKLLIADCLCTREHPSTLFASRLEDDWYLLLWNALQEGVHTADGISQNRVRFVTFNYDRSLEFFLHEAIKNSYGLRDDGAAMHAQSIPIIHVYGQLGAFDWSGAEAAGRQYSNEVNRKSLEVAANGIRIIPETRSDDETLRKIRDWVYTADQICILGFGFNPLNMERLGLHDALRVRKEHGRSSYICASVYGKTKAEVARIKERYFPGIAIMALDTTNSMTLRESEILV
jgi:hypothetical protein